MSKDILVDDEPGASESVVGLHDEGPRGGASATWGSRGRRWIADVRLTRYTGLVIWALIIAIFAVATPHTFLTDSTFKSIASNQSITLIVALGLLFSLAAGQFDLSVGQNLGTCASIAAYLSVHSHVTPVVACLAAVAFGCVVGAVNGTLVVYVGINSFIATLGMSSVLLALAEIITHYTYIGPVPQSLQNVVSFTPLGIPVLAMYGIGLAIICWYVLEHTPLGRRVYAAGANADAARLAGVRTNRYIFGSLVVTGGFAGIAACLLAGQVSEISSTIGPSYLLPAFAACFLGTTQFKMGRLNVWGAVLALYLLETGVDGLQQVGGPLWVTDLFNGAALVLAVGIAVVSERRRERRVRSRTARV